MIYGPLVLAHILTAFLSTVFGCKTLPSWGPGGHALDRRYEETCREIAKIESFRNAVFYPNSSEFQEMTSHFLLSSNQPSTCAILPKSSADVGRVIEVIGLARTPFAVQSGGHAYNPGWSSTEGVHISLSAFTDVEYDDRSATVRIGAGLRWEEVYSALEPRSVTVLGARLTGIGVGGLILGGGYSWHGNQHGLTLDTVTAFELVKPSGDVATVTVESDPELFFGLKGGQNNFGIVTKFTLKTFPQGEVWGGSIFYDPLPDIMDAVTNATVRFSAENTDPKASILSRIFYYQGTTILNVMLFYDGPTQPGVFNDFLAIPYARSTLATQSYPSLISILSSDEVDDHDLMRGLYTGIPIPEYSRGFLELLNDIVATKGPELEDQSLLLLGGVVEPFLPSLLQKNESPSAFPWAREKLYTPFLLYAQWTDPSQDTAISRALKDIRERLVEALLAEGHSDILLAPSYPNYALWDTPLEQLYGTNLPRLRALKQRSDPGDVMGLAGGFKIRP